MQFNVLITNNGKHSDEKLAIATAEDIVHVGAGSNDPLDGRKLVNRIAEIMEGEFRLLAEREHAGITNNGVAHLAEPNTVPQDILNDAVTAVAEAIMESRFAEWPSFVADKAAGYPYLIKSIGVRLLAAQHMHRDWYARSGKVGFGSELSIATNHEPTAPQVTQWLAAQG